MKKHLLSIIFLLLLVNSAFSQVVTPFTVRKSVTQKGGIIYLANTSSKAVPDNAVQNEIPPSGTGYNNNFTNGYVDIDNDSSTFMSSSDQLNLSNSCSEISWAGLYWGAIINPTNANYANRAQVKLKINSGSYVNLTADYIKDNSAGYKSYHCFKDVTSVLRSNGLSDLITVANVVTETGAKNQFGGWTIVVVYKDNTKVLRNLTVFDGLANVSAGYSTVDIPISGFQTPISGPVNFELGLVVYDGDRSLTGDQLMFKGASSFINLSDAIHNTSDVFNSTIANNGVLTPLRNPNYNNTLGFDANIFAPNNSTKNFIGNNAISATIRQTTGGETFLTQVVTSAIDVYEPDLRSSVEVQNITNPSATNANPGDILEYTVTGLNIGSDPSVNTFINDPIDGSATYVPNSLQIISGPNAGALTDVAGDDQGEYIANSKTVRVRIGTGANNFMGGTVNNSPTGTDKTVFKFRVQITTDCTYLYCHSVVNNTAHIIGTGNLSSNTFEVLSNQKIFDDVTGCAVSGTTPSPINVSGCSAPSVVVNSPICAGGTINLTATNSASASYLWTGPNGFTSTLASPSITDVTVANAGTYTVTITVPGTSCKFVNTINVEINAANAGPDQTGSSTCGLTSVVLAANQPTGSTGQWTIVSGTGGSFGTGHTATSTVYNDIFNGVSGNSYILQWTLSTEGCSQTTDQVNIKFNVAPSSAAISGVASNCNNKLNVAITGGTSPYTVSINNGVGVLNNYISGTDIAVNPSATTTYTLLSVADSNGCSSAAINPSTYQLVISNSMGTGTITKNNGPVVTNSITPANGSSTGASSSTSTEPWTNPSNISASDNVYTTQTKTSTGQSATYLYASGFGFNIPSNSVIDGIVVTVEKKGSASGAIGDNRISLFNTSNSSSIGSNKSISGNWPTTDTVSTYGSSTDVWGSSTSSLTPTIINSSTFGFRYRITYNNSNATASVDYATMAIYYHVGSTSYCDTDSGKTFTVSGFSNATNYTWTPPTGATITSGQGTTTATINFNGAGQSGSNYTISVTPSNSCGSGTPATLTIPISDCANSSLAIMGNVYKDVNGSVSPQKVDGTGVGIVNGTQLYVTLVKTNGTAAFVQTQPVNSDGSFMFNTSIVQANTYSITLSTTNYASGTNPTASLPTGCTNNGEIKNNISNSTAGNDGTIDGKVTGITFSANNNITNVNFGIKIPTAPVANNDAIITNEDTAISFNVTSNDTDIDGTVNVATVDLNLTTSGIQTSYSNAYGSWSVNSSGVVTFTPVLNFNGAATLSYKVNDNDSLTSNTATITVTVNPVNDAPSATASSVTLTQNGTYTFNSNDFNYTDIESNLATAIVIRSLPVKGLLTYNGDAVFVGQTILVASIPNLIYTPNVNEFGSAYTSFTFTVNDASIGMVAGTMTINVNHVNSPPVAVNDIFSTNQNTSVSFNILTNDTNDDGSIVNTTVDLDPLTAGQQNSIVLPAVGTFTNNGYGVITFVPTSYFYGTTPAINYTVNNSFNLTSNSGSISVIVTPAGAPTAVDDTTITTSINTSVVFNITDNDTATNPRTINASRVDLDPYTPGIQQAYYVSNVGQYSVDMSGELTFSPDWNYNGENSIHYTVKDSDNFVSNIATITTKTTWSNTAPFAQDDFVTTNEDTSVTYNITTNDYDLDTTHGNSGVIDVASVDLDPNTIGFQTSYTINGQGTFTVSNLGVITFTPVLNFNGVVDPLQYTVNDKDGTPLTSNVGYVYVTVNSVNDAPVALNDASTAMISGTPTTISFSLTNNDSDVDGSIDTTSVDLDPYTVGQQYSFSVTGEGTYSVDTNGVITFSYSSITPTGNLTPVYYTVKDNNGLISNIATITVTILPGTPVAYDDAVTTNEDVAVSYDVANNDVDTNGILIGIDPSTVALVGTLSTSSGVWSITDPVNSPGQITFTPAANFFGTASINYTVQDLDGNTSNQATLTVSVTSVNDVPSFTKGANQSLCKNPGAQTVNSWATSISAGPSNESSQNVTFTVTNNLNSLFSVQPTIDSTGNLTYTVANNQTGTATVSVQIQDDGGTANGGVNLSAVQTFTILVSPTSVAGTISGAATVCSGTNSTTLTLSGNTGTIQWQSSTDNSTFTNISGATSSTYAATNLTVTKYYRAVVTSGLCSSATTASVTITVNPTSVAGTVSGAATVCSGTNSTTLTLSGNTGTIQWQSSSNNSTFTNISGATSATYTATNLTATTYYRAVVTSGVCSAATTTSVTVTVNPTSVAGTISGAATVCSGTNSTTLTLSGNTGTIQWQSSTDNSTFTNISGATSATYTATNLTATTYYRAVVTSGVCSAATTTSVTVTVNSTSVAGTISGAATVCSGTNSTTLTLSGNTGTIQWQSSTDNSTFTNISGATTTTYLATNLTATKYYRAVVTSGVCSAATTTSVTVTVNPTSVAGTISGAATVCSGTNSTTLTLSGNTGTIQWQVSTNGTSWNAISGATSATYTATDLTATTYYRAVVTSGVCSAATTTSSTVSVNSTSVAGTISGAATVCSGTNSTTLTLSGSTGAIQWQMSTNGTSWNDISGATSATYTATDLTASTYYRAVVTSGVCSAATTTSVTVTVNSTSVAGTISGAATVCSGTNSTTLTLSGNTGTIQWQSSSNNSTFTNISGATSATYTATNLTATTYYRAVVTSGVCGAATTTSVTVTVNPTSVAGTISGAAAVCSGTNSTTLTLSGNTGTIQWQSSTDNSNFADISGATSATYTATNLTSVTYYRAVVTSGVCSSTTTASVTITINSTSVAGTISGASTVCSGTNSTTLTLSGNTGTIQWQSSTDNSNFADISGATSTTYTATDLTATTYYRVVVTNGVCGSVTSESTSIIVKELPQITATTDGNHTGSGVVVLGATSNSGTIYWYSSENSTTSLASGTTFTTPSISTTTNYYVEVENEGCISSSRTQVTATISEITVAPYITSVTNGSGCYGTSVTLNAAASSGIVNWYSSSTGGSVLATGNSYVINSLTADTTYYVDATANNLTTATRTAVSATLIDPSIGTEGPISGPTSLCLYGSNTATYVVSPVSGAVYYVWTMPQGVISSSSNGNSVTITYDPSFVSGTISVKAMSACGLYSNTNSLAVSKNSTPYLLFSGKINVCGLTTATYTATNIPGAYYNWTVPSGMSITSGDGTRVITVSIDPSFDSGSITLYTTSACGDSAVKTLAVSSTTGANSVSGPVEVCPSSIVTYSTAPAFGISSYNWTVSNGMTILSGNGTNSISVQITNTFVSGYVGVSLTGNCGTGPIYNVFVSKFKSHPILGPTTICQIGQITYDTTGNIVDNVHGTESYSVSPVAGASGYNWIMPSGVTILSGQNTNSIVVSFDLANFNSGTIGLDVPISCGTLSSSITVYKLGKNTSITGTADLCGLTTASYTVPSMLSNNFNWILPSWMTIQSGQGTNTINVSITGAVTSDIVKVEFISNCGMPENLVMNVGCTKSTKVQTTQCGTTLTAMTDIIRADFVTGSTGYKFEVSDGTHVSTYESTINSFNLTQISGTLTPTNSKTYSVRVALKLNGIWQPYGVSCNISTPAQSIGGTITGTNSSVCSGTNTTTLTASGYLGTLVWQKSTVAAPTWVPAGSTTSSIVVSNLTATTFYRVVASNGGSTAVSNTYTITIIPVAKSGVITSATSVCSGGNITFTSSAYTGSSISWEVSTTSATSGFTSVSGANGLTFTMNNVTLVAPGQKFYVRNVVSSGSCSTSSATPKTITIDPLSVAGTITGSSVVCSGEGKTLTLSGNVGKIQWQYSTDGTSYANVPTSTAGNASTFSTTSLNGTSSTYILTNITSSTYFRAVVTSGTCSSSTTTPVQMIVGTRAVAGTVTADATTLCPATGTNLTLTGSVGAIQWQKATVVGGVIGTFANISGKTTSVLATGNLSATTAFKAIVTIGACSTVETSPITITVNVAAKATAISGNTTVKTSATAICSTATVPLTMATGYVGTSLQWQYYNAGSATTTVTATTAATLNWTDINGATSSVYNAGVSAVGNIWYRVKVSSGTCSVAYSSPVNVWYKSCGITKMEINSVPFKVDVYPNPSSDVFTLTMTTPSEDKVGVMVYDMTGKLIDQREVAPSEVSELQIGDRYPSGVYNVIVTQGEETKTLRVIKR